MVNQEGILRGLAAHASALAVARAHIPSLYRHRSTLGLRLCTDSIAELEIVRTAALACATTPVLLVAFARVFAKARSANEVTIWGSPSMNWSSH